MDKVTIKLATAWTYREGVSRSTDYPAGDHVVASVVADAAEAAGVIEAPAKAKK